MTNTERNTLVEQNMGLAKKIAIDIFMKIPDARRYFREFDDIWQTANIALCRAASKYSPEHGTKFSTFVGKVVSNELITHLCYEKKYPAKREFEQKLYALLGHCTSYGQQKTDFIYCVPEPDDEAERFRDAEEFLELCLTVVSPRDRILLKSLFGVGCKQQTLASLAKERNINRWALRVYVQELMERIAKEKVYAL